jgi:hypothetical protein
MAAGWTKPGRNRRGVGDVQDPARSRWRRVRVCTHTHRWLFRPIRRPGRPVSSACHARMDDANPAEHSSLIRRTTRPIAVEGGQAGRAMAGPRMRGSDEIAECKRHTNRIGTEMTSRGVGLHVPATAYSTEHLPHEEKGTCSRRVQELKTPMHGIRARRSTPHLVAVILTNALARSHQGRTLARRAWVSSSAGGELHIRPRDCTVQFLHCAFCIVHCDETAQDLTRGGRPPSSHPEVS